MGALAPLQHLRGGDQGRQWPLRRHDSDRPDAPDSEQQLIPVSAVRLIALILGLLAFAFPAQGQDEAAAARKQALFQALLESEDEKSFEAAAAAAQEGGVSPQAVLEARFLFRVDQGDFEKVAALAPRLEQQKAGFRIEDSVIFSVPEEFYAIIEYCHALEGLEKGDHQSFEKHIKEAFWLSPRQAAAFAPHIERLRLDRAMANLKIDLAQKFLRQPDHQAVTLEELMGESTAIVLHFWSPWSNECEANLPDFLGMSRELARHKIPVASVLVEQDPDALQDAREFRSAIEAKDAGAWIVDNSQRPLALKLRVQNLPTMVVLSRAGAVLFNGHPSEGALWNTLRKIAPEMQRPDLQGAP